MMTRLLINEPPLLVLPTLAVKVGLNEAIVLQQLHYWIEIFRRKGDDSHFHEGKWWAYNTIDQWCEQFPFLTKRTVERVMSSLRRPYKQNGKDKRSSRNPLVVAKTFHGKYLNPTLWYTIDYDELYKLELKDE